MKRYLLFTAALLTLAACNKDETGPEGSSMPVEIRLTSSLEAQTRATHGLDTQLAEGETVHVWVDDAGTRGSVYEDRQLTADGSGALSGEAMYFPTTRNNVNIYAIHGNFGEQDLTASFWGSTVTHTVEADQLSTGTGYAVSDLVYGQSADVQRTKETVNLKLDHLLSKMEVVLVQGAGNPVAGKLEILNTQLEAALTPDKESGIAVEAAGSTGAIEIDHGITGSDESEVLNEAIIVPQTISSGTKFICVTTTEGGELYYSVAEDTTFEPGKKYRYTVTVSQTGLSVTAIVANWDGSGSGYTGSVGLESRYETDLSTVEVGDFITKSGQLIASEYAGELTETEKNEIVGVVFWTPDVEETTASGRTTPASLTDDKIMAADYPNCTHGLAVAVNTVTYDGSKTIIWQNSYYNVGSWQSSSFSPNSNYNASDFVSVRSGSGATDAVNYIYGYQNTIVYRAYNEYYEYSDSYTIFPAVALDEFIESYPAPANSTGWFFPSAKEMHMLYYKDEDDIYNSSGGTDTRDKVNISLAYVGDQLQSTYYWTSTEASNVNAIFIQIAGTLDSYNLRKTSALMVRAVCAF